MCVSTATSTSRRVKIRGSKRWRCRTPPRRITTGTTAITAECYAPNGASRITNLQDEIVRIVNNYSRMSFNFGPTLLSWLADFAPRSYRMIQDADRASALRYSGHGSAVAQVYNHIIMPLASVRDARTQIRWGIADFEHRFGRKPEGMWLAETAVSRWVLDLMAQEGIKYTILAPSQCARVRTLDEGEVRARAPRPPRWTRHRCRRSRSSGVELPMSPPAHRCCRTATHGKRRSPPR